MLLLMANAGETCAARPALVLAEQNLEISATF